MTFKEKWELDHPGVSFNPTVRCPSFYGYEPADINCANPKKVSDIVHVCGDCWNREMSGTTGEPNILDSGELTTFETGAVRSDFNADGTRKGRCDLLPLRVLAKIWRSFDTSQQDYGIDKAAVFDHIADFQDTGNAQHLLLALNSFTGYLDFPTAFLEVAKHYEAGAEKYGECNWKKGLPIKNYVSSMVRHYLKWLRGDNDEPHDRAFVWNALCCIWECDFSPRAKKPAEVHFMEKHVVHGYIPVVDSYSLPDLRPVGEMVSLGDCPIGPFDFNGVLGLKTEYANEVYTIVGGEHMPVNDSDMVQPLEVI